MLSKKSFHWSIYVVATISIIWLLIDVIICFTQNATYSTAGIKTNNDYILKGILDLMAIAGFVLLLIEKSIFNYIVIAIVLLFKLFFCVRQGTDISYAYLVGSNTPEFLIEILPLTAVLFTKKDGVTGWNTLLTKNPDTDEQKKSRSQIVSGSIQLIILGILLLGAIIINTRDYPDFVNTFSKKVSVVFNIHNNDFARLSLQKANEYENSGLPGKTSYYIDWCEKFNPNDKETVIGLAEYYFLQEQYDSAIKWYKKAYKLDPNDNYVKTAIARCLYYSNHEMTVPWAEALIDEDPGNPFAACILRDHYFSQKDDDIAFYWGLRAYCYKENRQDDHDLEVFSTILSNKICSTNYQNNEHTLILSKSTYDQPVISFSDDDYKTRIKSVQEAGIMALYMYNRIDIGILDDMYYFVYLPSYQEGEIWRSAKVKRNLDALLKDHPDVAISSLIVVR